MEKINIPEEGRYKCIILTNRETREDIFIAGPGEFHKDVARSFMHRNRITYENYCISGGGRIIIDKDEDFYDSVTVYGYSVDFGHMDINSVQELLGDYCIENKYDFINNTGEGY